ncbi:MAG TPA: hypothetical protein VG269_23850 [Tepidisphaeraceae bacterium]|jgi:hypothetical protein|nr:hypothetical protein [Tepidisphaeraceae bacterium]
MRATRWMNAMVTLLAASMAIIAVKLAVPRRMSAPLREKNIVEQKLMERIPELKLKGMAVDEAVKELGKIAGVNIVVKWEFPQDNRPRHRIVDVDLHDISLLAALHCIVGEDMHCNAEGEVVMVGPPWSFYSADMTVRVYDVRDLISDEYWGSKSPQADAVPVEEARSHAIVRAVKDYTNIENWVQSGLSTRAGPSSGGQATATACAGRLIVLQTTDGHLKVEKLLELLRKNKGP